MNSTIHMFSIEDQKFEIRHKMMMNNHENEEHLFVVYLDGEPFEDSRFTYAFQLDSMDEMQLDLSEPVTLYKIPTDLENKVREYLFN